MEVTSDQHRFHGRTTGRGSAPGSGDIPECGHVENPTVRYRIPCTLANSTFIISVSVENCGYLGGHAEATQGNPPPAQGTMSTIDMQVPTIDLQCSVRESASPTTQAALAGASELAQGIHTSLVVPLLDSDDSLQFRGRVEEEPYTTDDH